jgi:hypothetical protein
LCDWAQVLVRVEPSAYLEHQGRNRYVPRIYLTEGAGSVLGANFMQVPPRAAAADPTRPFTGILSI